ncbi:MAG: phosphate acyltransferase PlsX [Oscillospiraceae bacterium]|nr:phosphate acyltransferase PlsX [Oscillospiraceae bacterium]
MKIIIDAMGGDHAPQAIVQGALDSAKEFGVEIILVGRGVDILTAMKQCGYDTLPKGVEIAHADDVVDMHADAADVVKQHKGSSLVQGLKMLADNQGDAFISAGNTGALLSAATLVVKRIKGIRRAAFAPVLPIGSGTILMDAGANVVCTPEFLLQFGCMGSFYAKKAQGKTNPRVALLNNGVEDSKGDELHKEAYQLLKEAGEKGLINFVGNIEAREAVGGDVDVIVADGFSGNVFLKTIEGTALYMAGLIKKMFTRNILTKIGALLCKKGETVKKQLDYREVGGSLIIGISKPVIKAHGSSDARAIRGAIKQAIGAVESGYCKDIQENVASMSLPREVKNV